MTHEQWKHLVKSLAIEDFCSSAADIFIPRERSLEMAQKISEQASTNFGPDNKDLVQWREKEYIIGNVLILLEKGYEGFKLQEIKE